MRKHVRLLFPLLTLGFLVTLASCKKSESETQPDLAASVIGTYGLSSINVTGTTPIPITGVTSGTAVATRNGSALDQVNFAVTYTVNSSGVNANFSQNQTVDLKQTASAIDLYTGTTKFGTYASGVITVSGYSISGLTVDFTATKQ